MYRVVAVHRLRPCKRERYHVSIFGSARLAVDYFDTEANEASGPRITTRDSEVSAWVIPTNEELMIARHTAAQL